MEPLPLARQLNRYKNRFAGAHLELVLASMQAGNTAGELWDVPQGESSALLLLWDKGNNVLYLSGEVATPSSLTSLEAIVGSHIRPTTVAEGRSRFKTCALSPSLEKCLPELFPGVGLRDVRTLFLVHDDSREQSIPSPSLANLTVLPITANLLTSGGHTNSEYVRDEIRSMWPAEDRFYEYGFGTVAVLEGKIICWCTAEYLGPTRCGIGISTLPPYEGRGVATVTAAAFVREARRRSITPYWECDAANHGSVRVAEKVGFVRQSEEMYRVGFFAP